MIRIKLTQPTQGREEVDIGLTLVRHTIGIVRML